MLCCSHRIVSVRLTLDAAGIRARWWPGNAVEAGYWASAFHRENDDRRRPIKVGFAACPFDAAANDEFVGLFPPPSGRAPACYVMVDRRSGQVGADGDL